MGSCFQPEITDAAFAPLAGIRVLNLSLCSPSITDAAFAPLADSLRELDISTVDGPSPFSDAAFVHFGNLRKLSIANSYQDTITDAAFVYLRNISSLDMSYCSQLTDAALTHLQRIKELNVGGCTQLTGSTIASLELLDVAGCSMALICAAGAADLPIGDDEQEMYWCVTLPVPPSTPHHGLTLIPHATGRLWATPLARTRTRTGGRARWARRRARQRAPRGSRLRPRTGLCGLRASFLWVCILNTSPLCLRFICPLATPQRHPALRPPLPLPALRPPPRPRPLLPPGSPHPRTLQPPACPQRRAH